MVNKNNVFSEEYAQESGTGVSTEPAEEKKQVQTVAAKSGYYDKSKPHRVIIRAKEIEE